MFHHPALSVSVARNGHIFVMQGYNLPAFLILRDNVPQLLTAGTPNGVTWIPSFASSALSCYVLGSTIEAIRLSETLGHPGPPAVLFRLRSRLIAFLPNADLVNDAQILTQHGIDVVVTPQSMGSVQRISGVPTISILARLPVPETLDSAEVFAFPVNIICEAVEDAIAHTKILIYEN